jgi:LysM repeat protein
MEASVKRVILPVALVGALLAVGCKSNKPTTAPTPVIPAELNPPPAPQVIPVAPTPTPEAVVTPAPAPVPAPAPAAKAPDKAAKPAAAKAAAPVAAAHAKPADARTAASAKVYVVQKGDTLSDIAKKHSTTIKKIVDLNKGLNPDRIIVGQKIKMP